MSRVFNKLPASSREVITDITIKMGDGMASFVDVDMGQGTVSVAAYNEYCHMVAGLVGEGLSRAFVGRGMESEAICGQGQLVWPFCSHEKSNLGIANSMGLFLQKTNILRDYLEDYADGRAFWPMDVWKRFARTSDLGEFARPTAHGAGVRKGAFDEKADPTGAAIVAKGTRTSGLDCLNYLVADALELVPDCLTYLDLLRTPEVFRFSAIPQVMASQMPSAARPLPAFWSPSACHPLAIHWPSAGHPMTDVSAPAILQVMAIATLEACFNNPKVFTGVVKIRKGLTARLLLDSASLDGVHFWFYKLAKQIAARCPEDDPSRAKILAATDVVVGLTQARAVSSGLKAMAVKGAVLLAGVAMAVTWLR